MPRKGILTGLGLIVACLTCTLTAGAQCLTFLENTNAPDLEYMGLTSSGHRSWVGQEFATDCDGKFLTVSFLIDVQLFPDGAIPPLAAGDILTCTVMDDQNQPIASVDKTLTVPWGLEWVEFDFGFMELGLAAGTLAVKVSTPHDAYCRVATSLEQVDGRFMLGDENDLFYIATRDAGFRVTWDPDADITPVENQSWGGVKALFR